MANDVNVLQMLPSEEEFEDTVDCPSSCPSSCTWSCSWSCSWTNI